MDEARLMSRLRDNDASALDELIAGYWRPVVAYAQSFLGDQDAAYDVAQDAFIRLWQRRHLWDPRGSVRVWLLRTARNMSISEHRKRTVRAEWSAANHAQQAGGRSPLQHTEDHELRAAIHVALQELSARRREAFTLFHLQNLTYREIAEIMGVQQQTVANYLQAALADLRVSLKTYFPALGE